MLRPFPDVLIAGAMRAGTTFLHHALSAHPQVAPSRTKEPQFFSHEWYKGHAAYRHNFARRAPDWFGRAIRRPHRLSIDSSPYYLFHPMAPQRVRETLGIGIKVIALLRDPVDRAWSHYRFSLMRGHEHLGFLDALDAEEHRLHGEEDRILSGQEMPDAPHQTFSYCARGRYAEQLKRWWAHIPQEQFLLLKSNDLFESPQNAFDKVCRFLEIGCCDLLSTPPRNAAPSLELPAEARARLNTAFAFPNAELVSLTGIAFKPPV